MRKKQFKTESKKMLDMMINSIYTNREIFLRELISNASDAIDKRRFRALTEPETGLDKDKYRIKIDRDEQARTITITDNGCGMTADELEKNLGTIAKSGSLDFKNDTDAPDIDIIGQFGVGFYSAFMVANKVVVESLAVGADTAYRWESEGADGYTIDECDYNEIGSRVTLYLKEDKENEDYSEFLHDHTIRHLIKKYSDYVRYPIVADMQTSVKAQDSDEYVTATEEETLNSMVPIWHKAQNEVTDEEYNAFYSEKFFDYNPPAKVIRFKSEGTVSFEALLFIPKRPPFDYYSKNFEKGLSMYSSGVMIMEKCAELLPDYFSFVRGVIDSEDFTLNISRETLQHDHQLKVIAKAVEKKIANELKKMLKNERAEYESFFDSFGVQLKYGLYSDFGAHKETLQDLLLFKSSFEDKYVTLSEYVSRMKEDQQSIYYACGGSLAAAKSLPQTSAVLSRGFEVLYLTDEVDEFTLKTLMKYNDKSFMNVSADELDIASDEQKQALKEKNEKLSDLLSFIKESIGEVAAVRFSANLGEHPVCLSSEGEISTEMEKTLGKMPGDNSIKAQTVLEINESHPIADVMAKTYESDKKKAGEYAKVLYGMARLISGLPIDDPAKLSELVCGLLK